MSKDSMSTGIIFDIQRMSIHDGPGIRTVVFFKGCPLRCRWCHNPEGMTSPVALGYTPQSCIHCGACIPVCTEKAQRWNKQGKHIFLRSRCRKCMRCSRVCPTKALEPIGRMMTVAEVLEEVEKDCVFYGHSGGGLTVSGGEPFVQPVFLQNLLKEAHERSIHTCLETSLYTLWRHVEAVVPLVDRFLVDYKETNPARHQALTGYSNRRIVSNLCKLDALKAHIVLRCVLIPGINLRNDHIDGIAQLAKTLIHCHEITLLPYHPLGRSKLERIGKQDRVDGMFREPSMMEMDTVVRLLQEQGIEGITIG